MNRNSYAAMRRHSHEYSQFLLVETDQPMDIISTPEKTPTEFLGEVVVASVLGHAGAGPLLHESATSAVLAGDALPYSLAVSGELATVAYANIQQNKKFNTPV